MDRPTTRTEADARAPRLELLDAPVLPSRRPALDLCRSCSGQAGSPGHAQVGPVLLTGDAGVGKTWLWKRLQAESPAGRRWIAVDLTPSDDPVDLYRLMAHELGLTESGANGPASFRVGLVDFLASRLADGERINLVIEEAHNLSPLLWEEVRVLANRLDRPGGFASIILVGQTPLALRFLSRPFAAMEARLASKVHLGPIGVDEAKDLLARLRPSKSWTDEQIEILHRDASGNPGRLLRLAGTRVSGAEVQPKPVPGPQSVKVEAIRAIEKPLSVESPAPAPLTGPARPPIQSEENMIEVGWSPEDSLTPDDRIEESNRKTGPRSPAEGSEEAVRDHYAALQAWREWSENQARKSANEPISDEDEEIDEEMEEEDELEVEPHPAPSTRSDRSSLRAEGEQKFAPFGQLFSKMAQAREPE